MDAYIRKISVPRKFSAEEFDYFSEGIGISFNGGQDRHKTKIGALVSVCYLAAMIYFFQYFLRNSLDTESPKVQYSRINEKTANSMNLLTDEAFIFFLIENPNAQDNTTTSITTEGRVLQSESGGVTSDTVTGHNPRRRRLAVTAPNDIYLKFGEFKKAFDFIVTYTTSQVKLNQGVYSRSKLVSARGIIECSQASWFNDDKYQKALGENAYLRDIIKTYGMCLNLQPGDELFGDSISEKDAKITALIKICNVGPNSPCQQEYVDSVQYDDGQVEVIVGAFQNTVNNSNKEQPFSMTVNLDNSFKMDNFGVSLVNIQMKKTEVVTTDGTLIESKKTSSKVALESVSASLAPKLTLTTLKNQQIQKQDGTLENVADLDTGIYNKDARYFSVQIVSSRVTEQYSRKYDNLFDFFGNFGGAMEFVTVSFTILYVWYEEWTKGKALRSCLEKELNIPAALISKPTSQKGCCGWKRKNSNSSTAHQTGTTKIPDSSPTGKAPTGPNGGPSSEYWKEFEALTEKPLSYEQLAQSFVLTQCLADTLVPTEVKKLMPLVQLVKLRKEIYTQQQTGSNRVTPAESNHAQSGESSFVAPSEWSIEDCYSRLKSHEFQAKHPAWATLRAEYLADLSEIFDTQGALTHKRQGSERMLHENSVVGGDRKEKGSINSVENTAFKNSVNPSEPNLLPANNLSSKQAL